MNERVRMGLVGLGMMGRNHARVLRALDGVELVAVADSEGDKFGAADGVHLTPDVESMLEVGVDACIVSTPTVTHRDLGLLLAQAGVHALIEKPLTADPESAAEVALAFESRGLVGAVGHIERYNPALQSLRERLEAGDLGEIYQVATRRQGPFPNRVSDVGVVKDLATHDIDSTAWVTGADYRTVTARAAHKSGRAHEDLVAVVGLLENGSVANHLVNWLSPMKERVTVVTGERGCFEANTLSADLTFFENGLILTEWEAIARFRGVSEGNMTRFAIPKPEPLRTELEQFRDAVLGIPSDVVTMQQGLRTVVVADACVRSSLTGASVNVGPSGGRA